MDEAVFSSNQVNLKAWNGFGAPPIVVEKKSLGFKAIAVAACTDLEGRIVACHTVDKSIDRFSFIAFLKKVSEFTQRKWCTLFLDNLRLHYTYEVKEAAEKLHIRLLFNSPYSSEFNPIERLWAWSK